MGSIQWSLLGMVEPRFGCGMSMCAGYWPRGQPTGRLKSFSTRMWMSVRIFRWRIETLRSLSIHRTFCSINWSSMSRRLLCVVPRYIGLPLASSYESPSTTQLGKESGAMRGFEMARRLTRIGVLNQR